MGKETQKERNRKQETGTGSELRRTYRGQRKKVEIGCEVKPDHIGKNSLYEWLQKQQVQNKVM